MKYKKIPGNKIKKIGKLENYREPTITIITPFYNGEETLMETANSIFSQTYPFFEWIIINDGSTSPNSKKALTELQKTDDRVKIFTKENGGPSQARDYGISKSNPKTKYVYFIDCDDIIENNMIEMMYWTLETHNEASFTYPSIINFGAHKYYWEPYFTLEEELVNNILCINTMVRKKDLLEVGCFGIKEKAMYEDWNLWLKLLAKEKIPIRINPQSFWYRTSNTGELSRAKKNNSKALKLINQTAKTVKKDVEAIQYPRMSSNDSIITKDKLVLPMYDIKKSVLFIINNSLINYINISLFENIKRFSKEGYKISVLVTEPDLTEMRSEIQEYADEFFDLSNFLDYKDYPIFVEYLLDSRKINNVIISDWTFGYSLIPVIKEHNPNTKIHIFLNEYHDFLNNFYCLIDSIFCVNENSYQNVKNNHNNCLLLSNELSNKNKKDFIKKNPINKKILYQKFKIPPNKKIISFIDNLSYETRPIVFIELAKILLEKDNNLFFIMSGEGQMEKEIKDNIKQNNLEKHIIVIDEQENNSELIKLSDLIIKTSSKEGNSLMFYEALSLGTPIISNSISYVKEFKIKKCEIVDYIDTKCLEDYKNFALKYFEKVNKVLNDFNNYKKSSLEFSENNDYFYENQFNQIKKSIEESKSLNKEIFNSEQLYKYYSLLLKDNFRQKYLDYYKNLHGIKPRENINQSKFSIIKRRIRGISLKYRIENELHFVFKKSSYLIKAIRGLFIFLKNIFLYCLFLIPIILMVIKSFFKLIYFLLAKLIRN